MDTLIAFLVASVVTFFFVRRYVTKLALTKKPATTGTSAPVVARKTTPCPRCSKPVEEGASFCQSCGAALALWNVHRAEVQDASGPAEKGKPKPVINASLCIACGGCVEVCPETGTLELQSGKAILAHAERCTGHAKCVSACPTSAITLAFGGVKQTIRVPRVNERFETNIPGLFIVGELGGMGLIKTAINEGRLVIDHILRRLEEAEGWAPPRGEHGAVLAADPNRTEPYDVLIAGAGPAGLSASLAAHQAGLHYVTLEQGEVASTIRNYPRHKFLMAEPIEMPLYGTLYIADSTKEGLLTVWETIIANTGVRVHTNEGVRKIQRNGDGFAVETPSGQYHARRVVLALGKRGTPRRLGVPGEELGKVAYRLIEAESYCDSDVLVVGGGDSAIEAVLALSKGGRNRTVLSYRGDDFSRLRDRNREQLAAAEADGRVRVLRKSTVREIKSRSAILAILSGSDQEEIPNDFVFVLAGGESPDEFLRKTGVEIVEKAISG